MNKILEKNLEIVKMILEKAKDRNILFILSGSTSLALQGVDIMVHDIDIITDKEGAFKLDALLQEYCIKKMVYSKTEKYQSYFGQYEVEGTKVDIMGCFQYRLKSGDWSKENHLHPIYEVDYQGVKVPVLSLEQEWEEYFNVDKIETIKKITAKLESKTII